MNVDEFVNHLHFFILECVHYLHHLIFLLFSKNQNDRKNRYRRGRLRRPLRIRFILFCSELKICSKKSLTNVRIYVIIYLEQMKGGEKNES